ncbi:hypothetical protein D3C86_1066520 [compost metagenome]
MLVASGYSAVAGLKFVQFFSQLPSPMIPFCCWAFTVIPCIKQMIAISTVFFIIEFLFLFFDFDKISEELLVLIVKSIVILLSSIFVILFFKSTWHVLSE